MRKWVAARCLGAAGAIVLLRCGTTGMVEGRYLDDPLPSGNTAPDATIQDAQPADGSNPPSYSADGSIVDAFAPLDSSVSGEPELDAGTEAGVDGSIVTNDGGDASSSCTATDLCDEHHLGLDDDCNGLVDDDCPCDVGDVHGCFVGDPVLRGSAGCFDGVMECDASGEWGACQGGVHETQDCSNTDLTICHAIEAELYQTVDLAQGLGSFGSGALNLSWFVDCPSDAPNCPQVIVNGSSYEFKPLQAGEYTVTFQEAGSDGSIGSQCTFPLFVRSRGLRIELSWEHPSGDTGVDLDLYLHEPNDTGVWGVDAPVNQDCGVGNCLFSSLSPPPAADAPDWFVAPWLERAVMAQNTCYFLPGSGGSWQGLDMGCHSPRMDLDVDTCDSDELNADDPDFCASEVIAVDQPPAGQWFRIGVSYADAHALSYDVHPSVKVFCDGALAARLGPANHYVPSSPVTFVPGDAAAQRFWLAADVAMVADPQRTESCVVVPLLSNTANRTPYLTDTPSAQTSFGPAYPPGP